MGRRWRTASGKVHFLVGITRKWDVGHFCLTHAGCSAHTELWLLIMPILPLIYNCSAHLLVRSFSAVPLFPCMFQSAGVPGMFAHLPWGMFVCPPSLRDVCLLLVPARAWQGCWSRSCSRLTRSVLEAHRVPCRSSCLVLLVPSASQRFGRNSIIQRGATLRNAGIAAIM